MGWEENHEIAAFPNVPPFHQPMKQTTHRRRFSKGTFTSEGCNFYYSIWYGGGCPRHLQCHPFGCTFEGFIQESGRAGRNDNYAFSTVYYHAMDISAVATENTMRSYCRNNDQCRRCIILIQSG